MVSQWRATLHSFQGNSQRAVLHSCHVVQVVVLAIAFICAWWLHAEFVAFDYAVSVDSSYFFLDEHFWALNLVPKCKKK